MDFREYQKKAMHFCMKDSDNPLYMLFELCEEVGELHGKFAKGIRKGLIVFDEHELMCAGHSKKRMEEFHQWKESVKKEIGDIAWGLAGLCQTMGWSLEEMAKMNIEKLTEREKNGTIIGEGDGVTKEERL